jgi:Fic-DOC domain mobile mystery protein B
MKMPIENKKIAGTTPLDDYSGLKITWVYDHAQLDAVEADNIRFAVSKYLDKRMYRFPEWFSILHINQVHKAMFGQVWKWAGKYRQTTKTVGVAPYKIQLEMANLEEDIKFWGHRHTFDPIETSARVHHRLVWIHPYENGNGRHGRFIGDMVLGAFGYQPIIWPNLAENGDGRNTYIQSLKDADKGDFSALLNFLASHRS